nr:hypothetical protein CFP56_02655 [Quercus suber]
MPSSADWPAASPRSASILACWAMKAEGMSRRSARASVLPKSAILSCSPSPIAPAASRARLATSHTATTSRRSTSAARSRSSLPKVAMPPSRT